MGGLQFEVLKRLVFDNYGRCKYEKALEFAKIAAENFPDKMTQTSYWLICLHSRLEQKKEAISTLKEALDKKLWWSPKKLLMDEDLNALRSTEAFKYMIGLCSEMESRARLNSKPELLVYTPENYYKEGVYPLLVSIHWQEGNALEYSQYWRGYNVIEEYILAFPQSSQVSAFNEYHWENEDLAEKEISDAYRKIQKEYRINSDKMIITGTSQGGKLAIKLALKSNQCYFKGFIAVIPALGREDLKELISFMEEAAVKGIRGCIIYGEQDTYHENVLIIQEAFKQAKFPCKFIKVNTLGHSFPDDFSKKLKAAISYIL